MSPKMLKTPVRTAMATLMAVGVSATAAAEDYPSEAISMVVPFSAGGGTDTAARLLSQFAEEYLGQPIAVDNRAGGAAAPGTAFAANAPADGYTLYLATPGPITVVPMTQDVPYDPAEDFRPIIQIAANPVVLLSREDAPWDDLESFQAYGQDNPGDVLHAMLPAAYLHIAGEAALTALDVDVTDVPHEGTAPAVADVTGGHADIVAAYPPGSADLRPLGVMGQERSEFLPDTPTFAELGHDVYFEGWRAIFAPADTPDEVVDFLVDAFTAMLEDPEYQEAAREAGESVVLADADGFLQSWETERAATRAVLEELDMLAE